MTLRLEGDVWVATVTTGRQWMTTGIRFGTDDATPIDAEDVTATCEFRTASGLLIASPDVEVEQLTASTVVLTLRLASAVTETLTPSYNGAGAIEFAGWGDIKASHPDIEANEPQPGRRIHLRIHQGVTA